MKVPKILDRIDGAQMVRIGVMLAMVVAPQAAMADPTNITSGLTSIQTWLISAAKIIAVIAIIACGLAKMAGRMEWGRFFIREPYQGARPGFERREECGVRHDQLAPAQARRKP